MTPIKPSETSMADTVASQSRREALKKFGRYAAAAPTAMVLLQSRESHAGKKDRGRKSSRGRKSDRGRKGRKGGKNDY
jgi:hypothetical protein